MLAIWKKIMISTVVIVILVVSFLLYTHSRNQPNERQRDTDNSQVDPYEKSFRLSSIEPLQFGCSTNKLPEQTTGIQIIPQGQFCRLKIKAENITNQPKDLKGSGTYLLASDGKKYALDLYTMSLINNSWTTIEPRASIETSFVFDIPKKVKPLSIELRDNHQQTAQVITIPTP